MVSATTTFQHWAEQHTQHRRLTAWRARLLGAPCSSSLMLHHHQHTQQQAHQRPRAQWLTGCSCRHQILVGVPVHAMPPQQRSLLLASPACTHAHNNHTITIGTPNNGRPRRCQACCCNLPVGFWQLARPQADQAALPGVSWTALQRTRRLGVQAHVLRGLHRTHT